MKKISVINLYCRLYFLCRLSLPRHLVDQTGTHCLFTFVGGSASFDGYSSFWCYQHLGPALSSWIGKHGAGFYQLRLGGLKRDSNAWSHTFVDRLKIFFSFQLFTARANPILSRGSIHPTSKLSPSWKFRNTLTVSWSPRQNFARVLQVPWWGCGWANH